jgi:hypothetical protein
MKWLVYFEVKYEMVEHGGELKEAPSAWFIEGCLKDLAESHGLICKKVIIKENKETE